MRNTGLFTNDCKSVNKTNHDISDSERIIFEALMSVKQNADEPLLNNSQIGVNESYFAIPDDATDDQSSSQKTAN
jgi:hypothetical protein